MQQLTRAFLTDSRKTALRMLQCPFGDQRFKTVSSLELCLGNRDCKKVQRFTQKKSLVKVWNHCTVFVPQTLFTLKTPAVKVGGWVTHLPSLSLTQAYTPLSCISASHLQPPTRKSKTTAWPWELKVQHRPLSSSSIMVSSGTIWVCTATPRLQGLWASWMLRGRMLKCPDAAVFMCMSQEYIKKGLIQLSQEAKSKVISDIKICRCKGLS